MNAPQMDLFPPKPDALRGAATLEELEAIVRDADCIEAVQDLPNPSVALVASRDAWPELPTAALHGLAGDVVRAIEPHSEADPAAILIQTLVAVANMIGPGPHCMVEATRHALNLYAVLVGKTSKGRKGTSWDHIGRLCSQVDQQWAQERVSTAELEAYAQTGALPEWFKGTVGATEGDSQQRLIVDI